MGPDTRRFVVEILLRARDEISRVAQQAVDSINKVAQAQQQASTERAKAVGHERQQADELEKLVAAHTREKKALDDSLVSLRKEAAARRQSANDARSAFEELRNQARLNRALSAEREKQQIEEITRIRREVAERDAAEVKKTRAYQKETKALRDRARVLVAQAAEESAINKRRASEIDLEIARRQNAVRELERQAVSTERQSRNVERSVAHQTREIKKLENGLRNLSGASRNTDRDGRGLLGFLRSMRGDANNADLALSKLSSTLRGFQIAFVIKYAQAIISALISLGATLVAVASSAIQAGAALVGGLAAGAAQALPIIGALGAALIRVGAVIKAVNLFNQQQLLTQHNQAQASERQRAASERLRNAEQSSADATRRLSDAQRERNQVLREARAEVDALHDAEVRSSLSLEQAQARLRQAIRSGGSAEVAQAQVDVSSARRDVGDVRADVRSVRRTGFTQQGAQRVAAANRAVADAQRGVARSAHDVADAQKQAAHASDQQTAASDRLQAMLALLSPAERGLYRAILRIQKTFREGVRPITDIIIRAFTRGVNRGNELLQDPQILRGFRRVSQMISDQIDTIIRQGSSRGRRNFFTFLTLEVTRNGPIVTRILIHLLDIFENIARAGAPAFHEILVLLERFTSDAEIATSRTDKLSQFFLSGVDHLQAWARLLGAVINLFVALVTGSAPTGLRVIQDATRWLNNMTRQLRENSSGVSSFFENARKASYQVFQVIGALGRAVAEVFTTTNVKTFTDFLMQVVIPALADSIQVMGFLTSAVHALLSQPVISELARWLATIAILSRGLAILKGAVSAIGFALGFVRQEGKLLFVGNPWILGITAIIAALAILDEKFGILRSFFSLFGSGEDKAKAAADRLNESIRKQIDLLNKARDAEMARRNAQLGLERAQLGVIRARQEVNRVQEQIQKGELKGRDADLALKEAKLGLRQAVLDERGARDFLRDSKREERKADQQDINQSVKTINSVRQRVDALKDERDSILKRRDDLKEQVRGFKELVRTTVPGTLEHKDAVDSLRDAQKRLANTDKDLKNNTDDLRGAANKGETAFKRWRKAVRLAGGSADDFSDVVHDAMSGVVQDVNQILTEFGAKPLKFSIKRSHRSHRLPSGASDIFGTPDIGGFPGHQSGGWVVPGRGSGDIIPMHAMVEPGEEVFVLNRNAAAMRRMLEQFNGDFPRFQRGGIVPIPGQPGESIDRRILRDVLAIIRRYHARVTDGYAPTGHAAGGEHPLGLAVDLVPGAGGSWDMIDRLAHWAEPSQNNPRYPFRWVGYTGDPHHGRGNHLHLSWLHDGLKTVQTLRGAIGGLNRVRRQIIEGRAGALRTMAQGFERRMRTVSNRFIDRQTAMSASGGAIQINGSGYRGPLNRVFPMHTLANAAGHVRLSPRQVMRIAQDVGLPGRTFEQIAHGESQYYPGVVSSDGGWGLWQMTPRVWGSAALAVLRRLGGIRQMLNPIKNSVMAKYLYDAAGHTIAPWFGTKYVRRARGGSLRSPRLQSGGWMPRLQTGGYPGNINIGSGIARAPNRSPLRFGDELRQILRIFDRLGDQLGKTKNIAQRVRKSFERVFEEGGLFDQIGQIIEKIGVAGARRVQSLQFRITGGRAVRGSLTEAGAARREGVTLRRQRAGLRAEGTVLSEGLDTARDALRAARRRHDHQAAQQAKAEVNRIRKLQDDLRQALVDNAQAQVEAQERMQQAMVDAINSGADRFSAAIERVQKVATAVGREIDPRTIISQNISVMRNQVRQLRTVLKKAQRSGNVDLANQLRGQIADLNVSIAEGIAERFQASIDIVNKNAEKKLAVQDRRLRFADIGGTNFAIKGSALTARGRVIGQQISQLSALRDQAAANKNTAQVEALTSQIEDLKLDLAENTQAIKDNTDAAFADKVSKINEAADFSTNVLQGAITFFQNLGDLTGQSTLDKILPLLTNIGKALDTQRSGLLGSLADLLGLKGDARKDVIGLKGQGLVDYLLSISSGPGFDAIMKKLSPAQQDQFKQLIQALIGNTNATNDNSKQMKELGDTSSPQEFSTTAWRMFRNAIFTGSGGLLPQYAKLIPRAQYGGHVMTEGVAYLHADEDIRPKGERDGGFAASIYVTEPVEEAHPDVIVNRLFWAYRNRPLSS